MFGLGKIKGWWNRRKVKGARRAAATALADMLDKRFNARRMEWDREDSELRSLMSAAGGAQNWGAMMQNLGVRRTPTLDQMAGGSISARFDSAQTTDDNRLHWSMADGLAADAAANPAVRYTLRNRARYEDANNCYCKGVGETIANDFAGTGPRLHIDDDRLSDEEKADFEEKFAAWAKAIGLARKLKTMRKARRVDGEALACKFTNPRLPFVKLDFKVIEADRLRDVDLNLTERTVDGIRLDVHGNPIAYTILRQHPGYWSYATGNLGAPWEFDVWDASQVIHWFRQDRPEQHRGLPEILAALPLYATLRRYTQATVDAAETAADYAVLLETQSGALFLNADGETTSEGITEAAAFSTVQLQRRMMAALPAGYKATQMRPEQPTQQYGGFKREICAEIGRCEGVPSNAILADSSNSSFASGQLDHKIYFRTREIEREEANTLILDDLLADFIAEGVRIRDGKGDMGNPYLPSIMRTIGAGISHAWYWDSNELGDPLKLAAAKSTELKNGTTTIPAIYEGKKQNWKKAFAAQARALGITVEELQMEIKNAIFPAQPDPASPADTADDAEGGESATVKPQQAATQKVAAMAAKSAVQDYIDEEAEAVLTAFNDNHDEQGRFSESGGGGGGGAKSGNADVGKLDHATQQTWERQASKMSTKKLKDFVRRSKEEGTYIHPEGAKIAEQELARRSKA